MFESPGGPRRLAVLSAPAVVPWVVQVFAGSPPALVFAWGLVGLDPLGATDLLSFLFVYTRGLPEWILAWPVGAACYLLGVVSAVSGWRLDREDRRVTAGLFALAGLSGLWVAWGFSAQPGRTGLPVGTALLWALAWWTQTGR